MKINIERFKRNRLLNILIIITIIFIIFGSLFLALQSREVKVVINNTIIELLNRIRDHNYNYKELLITSLSTNILINVIIWVLGISLIGLPVILGLYVVRCIMLSFTVTSFIYCLRFRGILFGFIYTIPSIISLLVCFIMTYYSLQFTKTLFIYLFINKDSSRNIYGIRYLKLLGMVIFLVVLNSLFETFIITNILRIILSFI